MNIFLIGFMGSGKSNFGKKLAHQLSKDFLDLDEMVESAEGKNISHIFSDHNETYFRKVERDFLFTLNQDLNAVIALGGGTPCDEVNWTHIHDNGLTVYLKESESILYGRLKQSRSTRPLISSMDDETLRSFIQEKLRERSVYYDRADITFEKDKTRIEVLKNQLENYTR